MFGAVSKHDQIKHGTRAITAGERSYNKYLIAGDEIRMRTITLLGHIIWDEIHNDHMKRITMNMDLSRFRREHRRVGRPRFKWLETAMTKASNVGRKKCGLPRRQFSIYNEAQREEIKKAALGRQFFV